MTLRETTDHGTPLAIERYSAGSQLPLLTTAAGRVYLAFCPPAQRDALIESWPAPTKKKTRRRATAAICCGCSRRSRPKAMHSDAYAPPGGGNRPQRPGAVNDRHLASLTVRFAASAMPLKSGLERFLPKLRHMRG